MRAYKLFLTFIPLSLCLIITGCGINHKQPDPYEHFNRSNFQLNQAIKAPFINKQCSKEKNKKNLLFSMVNNVSDNIDEVNNMVNDILQMKGRSFFTHLSRLVINTTLGLGGLFDPASDLGLPKHRNDFSLTLAYYGNGSTSEYLVLPFIGPTTVRKTFAIPFNTVLNPLFYLNLGNAQYIMKPAFIIAENKSSTSSCPQPTTDAYQSTKQAFLKQRQKEIEQSLNNK